MLTVMAKAKSNQKKGKQANLSKARKKGNIKKKLLPRFVRAARKRRPVEKQRLGERPHVLKRSLVLRHSPRLHLKK